MWQLCFQLMHLSLKTDTHLLSLLAASAWTYWSVSMVLMTTDNKQLKQV